MLATMATKACPLAPTSTPAQEHDKPTQGIPSNGCTARLDGASSWRLGRGGCACGPAARAVMRRAVQRSGPTDSESSCEQEVGGGTARPDSRRPTPARRSKPGGHSYSGSRSLPAAVEAVEAADAAKAVDSSGRNSAGSGEGSSDERNPSPTNRN